MYSKYDGLIFTRRTYTIIAHEIARVLRDCISKDQLACIIISGTQGIGKSVFYLWLVQQLHWYFEEIKQTGMVLANGIDEGKKLDPRGRIAISKPETNEKTYEFLRGDDEDDTDEGKEGWVYLYDNVANVVNIQPFDGHAIYFSSPAVLDDTSKRRGVHSLLYMDLWTLQEMAEYRALICKHIPVPRVALCFATYGGRILPLDETAENWDDAVKTKLTGAINKWTLDELVLAFNGELPNEKSALIHHKANNDFYNGKLHSDALLIPGSPFIASEMVKRLDQLRVDKYDTLTKLIDSDKKASTLRGWLYEDQINGAFWRGNREGPNKPQKPLK